jgi:large subunit ribosomal protein L15
MELHNLIKIKTNRSKKRLGRGIGSGKGGHTVGRGTKGQKARTGYNLPRGFEGGQVPLWKKVPQIGGFKSLRAKRIISISLSKFNLFEDGVVVTPQSLIDAGVLKRLNKSKVKVLDYGKLEKKVELKGFLFSKSAKDKLKKAGAKIS